MLRQEKTDLFEDQRKYDILRREVAFGQDSNLPLHQPIKKEHDN